MTGGPPDDGTEVDFVAALGYESDALFAAVADAGLGAAVPMCGSWTMADLVFHLAEVYSLFGQVVAGGLQEIDGIERLGRPADDALVAVCRERLATLTAALRDATDDRPVWTFTADRTVGFVRRRMAIETAVHRWDAQHAAGTPRPIDGTSASAGIDEFVHHFVHRRLRDAAPVDGSVHVHCGDVPGEWTLRPDPATGAWVTAREHAKGDCALRGAASDLLLVLWRRVPLSAVDVVGDPGVAERFIAASRL